MKNLILALIVGFAFLTFNNVSAQSTPMTASTATVTNTASVTLTLKVNDAHNVVSVQYVATKVSGTVAGTATLYGSIDGTNYAAVPVAVIKGGVNAYTNTDVTTNTYIWSVQPSSYNYYQVQIAGAGTMVTTVAGKVIVR